VTSLLQSCVVVMQFACGVFEWLRNPCLMLEFLSQNCVVVEPLDIKGIVGISATHSFLHITLCNAMEGRVNTSIKPPLPSQTTVHGWPWEDHSQHSFRSSHWTNWFCNLSHLWFVVLFGI